MTDDDLDEAPAGRPLAELADTLRPGDDDELDGCGARGANDDPDRRTDDGDIDALVLFADVDFLDPEAVEARELEWAQLAALEDDQ